MFTKAIEAGKNVSWYQLVLQTAYRDRVFGNLVFDRCNILDDSTSAAGYTYC